MRELRRSQAASFVAASAAGGALAERCLADLAPAALAREDLEVDGAGQDVDAVMEALSTALTRKMLHGALSELHGSAGEAHQQWAESLQRLFLRDSA